MPKPCSLRSSRPVRRRESARASASHLHTTIRTCRPRRVARSNFRRGALPTTDAPAGEADLTRWPFIPNLLAVPAASIPVATSEGLPIGVQLVANRGGEALLLSLARAIFTRVAPPSAVI